MLLAAIDIGSNAARLLIQDVTLYKDGTLDFTKVNFLRMPLRLGFDVFETGFISASKIIELTETMKAFKHLLNIYNVKGLRICATSAMRDAKNAEEVIHHVQQHTGLLIEVISGNEEAQILYESHLADNLDNKNSYLYIDVGGGSTELTLFSKSKMVAKQSFNLGTIRLLKDKVGDDVWENMKLFLKNNIKSGLPLVAIGTGGNINKVFSISKRKNGKPLSIDVLKDYYKEMSAISVQERMHRYGFKIDRADVIVPALEIYIAAMRWGGIQDILVPQIGLADGLIKLLHKKLNYTSLMGIPK